ncbi:Hypothetical protein NTJ_00802 [Nesidiocoris tenuis]|uniref:Uncharacterized protein n=1 Tax=Nesidiocoris tenuis TaxID=355587 RepID=A0ABN7A6X0_9HEMI|nr:Hypothetical protein NTJ_00802 [Nesidiocoris tenuis]
MADTAPSLSSRSDRLRLDAPDKSDLSDTAPSGAWRLLRLQKNCPAFLTIQKPTDNSPVVIRAIGVRQRSLDQRAGVQKTSASDYVGL